MIPNIPFVPFSKIHRYNRDVIITEKLDGTNAVLFINDEGTRCFAGSRTRWITPEDDNYGFAKFVRENHDELLRLGPGQHFGEWWGQGIQRKYGLAEKRFSLFNTSRWSDDRPSCCHVVPVLAVGKAAELSVLGVLNGLVKNGSTAVPGFMNPEGIVIYHAQSRNLYKMTLDKNDEAKGSR